MKRAFVTGITGQDGSYLAELLLSKGYEVHGLIRRSSTFNTRRLDHIYVDPHEESARLLLHYGELSDAGRLTKLLRSIEPHELYHLGAQSHVRVSFDVPEYTADVTALGTVRILEALRHSGLEARFLLASSSEIFGGAPAPQNEESPLRPRSPYAAAKAHAHCTTINYREAYDLFACNAILFNHESPRRGETFLSRKVTRGIARILNGQQELLYLGNLEARRDWGYAPEYVEAMWRLLQKEAARDFVIGTGESHTVREFVECAFGYAGLSWKKHLKIDPRYFRPTEADHLQADPSRATNELGWKPRIGFEDLARIMVDADLEEVGLSSPGEGAAILREAKLAWTVERTSAG